MRKSFTMLELIFVIVIIGILAAIAMPKLWVTRNDAVIAKARTEVGSIRSSIANAYSKNIINGINKCPELEGSENDYVFENVLKPYPIKANQSEINWTLDANNSNETNYTVTINGLSTKFVYKKDTSQNCPFKCNSSDQLCKDLTQ